jgi:hypothetical protein
MSATKLSLGLTIFLACQTIVLADGKFFGPPRAIGKVEIPDQQALICFSNGVETLVIDTAFRGGAGSSDFAWVVPLPTRPHIAPATPGLFPTLQVLCAPKVTMQSEAIWFVVVLVGGVLLVVIGVMRAGGSLIELLLVLAMIAIMAGLLLPALAQRDGSGAAAGSVRLLDRAAVGAFDTVTIESTNGQAVVEWLKANGFAAAPEVEPVLRDYAREGWVFVASKLRTASASGEVRRVHPLAFTFLTQRPVYPLRLTGVGNPPLKVDLYVLGDGRAAARDFTVEVCQRPTYLLTNSALTLPRRRHRETLDIAHPELRRLAAGLPVLTKLSATLSPTQMASDAWIEWQPFKPHWRRLWTPQAAAEDTFNLGVTLLMAGLVVTAAAAAIRRGSGRRILLKGTVATVAIAGIVSVVHYARTPQIRDFVSMGRPYAWHGKWRQFEQGMHWLADEVSLTEAAGPHIGAVLRERAASALRSAGGPLAMNPYAEKPPREEDSPGNYEFRCTNGAWALVWFDQLGGEHTVMLAWPSGPREVAAP